MESFQYRQLRASLVLPQTNFQDTGTNTIVLTGYKMTAHLSSAGNFTNKCDMRIFGISQSDMIAVTVLWNQTGNPQNVNARAVLILEVPNAAGNWSQIFSGQFQEGGADYSAMPSVNLSLSAATGYGQQILPGTVTSKPGAVPIVLLAQEIALKMGYTLEVSAAVQGTISNPYYYGSPLDQWRELMRDARLDYYFTPNGNLAICPANQPRQAQQALELSPDTGLIGYPKLTRNGIEVDCLFTPELELGVPIVVSGSPMPAAMDGLWFPYAMEVDLEAITPNGQWFAHLQCMRFSTKAPGT